VPGASPVTSRPTPTAAVPEPTLRDDVREPYFVLVPYSNQYDVERPFALTLAVSVAEVESTFAAAPVVAVGWPVVANRTVSLRTSPASLRATMRKWYVVPGRSPLTA